MSAPTCTRLCPCALLTAIRSFPARLFQWAAAALPRRHRVPVEIVIVDAARRKLLKHELSWGLRRLQCLLGEPLPTDVAVLVQQVIPGQSQVAGCYQIGTRPGGERFALIRLALQVNGKRLSSDELLAALAEQCIGLLCQSGEGTSVTVPIQLEPAAARESDAALPPDPLAATASRYRSQAA